MWKLLGEVYTTTVLKGYIVNIKTKDEQRKMLNSL